MNRRSIEQIAAGFWHDAGMPWPPAAFPAPIEAAVPIALPLWIAKWPSPQVPGVASFLSRLHRLAAAVRDEELRGCLFAYRGAGIVFVCGTDDPAEQRLTIAHEVAHFILDYQRPRNAVVRAMGTDALAVLDGDRPPTERERLHALLARLRFGPHLHLVPRHRAEQPCAAHTHVVRAEEHADELALELVAPLGVIASRLARIGVPTDNGAASECLAAEFGVPGYALRPAIDRLRPVRLRGLLDHARTVLRPTDQVSQNP
ncbi:ImmA/IrrE family metallo-endopeptidase [Fontivita pretiosa]|uniref:ImmA/IrrE family metallo-endopeptidase n=1 Tax=Fontivita pretiosa TaxID=2989684 RepID=UPI003D1845BC